jgi:hypothetical protein
VKRPSLSSYAIALLLIGVALTSVGVGFQFGAPWGLMLSGVALTVGGVVIVRDLLRAPREVRPRRPPHAVSQVRPTQQQAG